MLRGRTRRRHCRATFVHESAGDTDTRRRHWIIRRYAFHRQGNGGTQAAFFTVLEKNIAPMRTRNGTRDGQTEPDPACPPVAGCLQP
jgi:hypothetical protein